jgi:hypothetical protein
MPQTHISVHVEHPDFEPGPVRGFKFFWAYYVNGFDQTVHCQPCFKGSLSRQFNTRTAQSGKLYTMNERKAFRYLYICGVGVGQKHLLHQKNFHLPVEVRLGASEIRYTLQRIQDHGRERNRRSDTGTGSRLEGARPGDHPM